MNRFLSPLSQLILRIDEVFVLYLAATCAIARLIAFRLLRSDFDPGWIRKARMVWIILWIALTLSPYAIVALIPKGLFPPTRG